LNSGNIKIVFGLKAKQKRTDLGLTLQNLSKKSGLSVSYLNEIEKGKKYPKPEKITKLAYEEMVSLKLEKKLALLGEIIQSNVLNELPLEFFGVDSSKILTILSEAPTKVNAFVSTILELSRNNELRQEHFYHTALRSYQELNYNHFKDLERLVIEYRNEKKLDGQSLKVEGVKEILFSDYGYSFKDIDLESYPELVSIRSVLYPDKGNLLLTNPNLSIAQRRFVFARELAFNVLKVEERPLTFSYNRIKSFDELHNNFRASYFSVSLLIDEEKFIADLQKFFEMKKFDSKQIGKLLTDYQVTPEMLLHRMTSLLPKFFGIKSLFFLRFNNSGQEDYYSLSKEMHLSKKHNPHGNRLGEHYCRRWVALGALKDLKRNQKSGKGDKPVIRAQISKYIGSENEYLCLSIASPMSPTPGINSSVTLGLLVNTNLRKKVAFLNDLSVKTREVNSTCERCPAENCKERVAEAYVVNNRNAREKVKAALTTLRSSL
jgi:transcriptional regulator with XRE-family HTH domain/Zn-dependent peptidase ImmA (M78 family)